MQIDRVELGKRVFTVWGKYNYGKKV